MAEVGGLLADANDTRFGAVSTSLDTPGTVAVSGVPYSSEGILVGSFHGLAGDSPPESLVGSHSIYHLRSGPVRYKQRLDYGRVISSVKKQGSLTLVPAGIVPEIWLSAPADFLCCVLDGSLLDSVISEMDGQPFTAPSFRSGVRSSPIETILRLIKQEIEAGALSGNLYTESLTHALAVRFVLAQGESGTEPAADSSSLPVHVLHRVQELIEANLGKPLTLVDLSSESGYSRSHFLRMFRSSVGQTPHRYVLEQRIRRAQRMLKQKLSSLVEIAAACGFSSQAHMNVAFRKQLNVTPAQYRRNF